MTRQGIQEDVRQPFHDTAVATRSIPHESMLQCTLSAC